MSEFKPDIPDTIPIDQSPQFSTVYAYQLSRDSAIHFTVPKDKRTLKPKDKTDEVSLVPIMAELFDPEGELQLRRIRYALPKIIKCLDSTAEFHKGAKDFLDETARDRTLRPIAKTMRRLLDHQTALDMTSVFLGSFHLRRLPPGIIFISNITSSANHLSLEIKELLQTDPSSSEVIRRVKASSFQELKEFVL